MRRVAAGVVEVILLGAVVWIVMTGGPFASSPTPTPAPTGPSAPATPTPADPTGAAGALVNGPTGVIGNLVGCAAGLPPGVTIGRSPASEARGPAATLVADYRFQGSLGPSTGTAPALSTTGPSTSGFVTEPFDGSGRRVLSFPAGGGLVLHPVGDVLPDGAYSIVMLFRLAQTRAFAKLVDFEDATSDDGLYSYAGCLNFYPAATGTMDVIGPNGWAQVVLTRGRSGVVVGYVNGIRQFSFTDEMGIAALGDGATLRFFQDDNVTAGEQAAGAVARIRLYAGALTGPEVEALTCAELPSAICGADGPNTLIGTPGDDVILGLGGDDVIVGLEGTDLLAGGSGVDVLRGGEGPDRLTGGADADALDGGGGRDVCDVYPELDTFAACEALR